MASDAERAHPDDFGIEYRNGGSGVRRFLAELLGDPPSRTLPYPPPPVVPAGSAGPTEPLATPPGEPPVSRQRPPVTIDRLGLAWRGKWWILLVTILAGVGAYLGCTLVAPTYESSATLRIVVQSGNGVSQDAVLASNDLATQYAALVRISPVIGPAAARLGIAGGTLSSAVSSGTEGDQNLVDISARAASTAEAQRRANAVARQFVTFVRASNRRQTAVYNRLVNGTLAPIRSEIAALQSQLGSGSADTTAASVSGTQATLATLLAARQHAAADLAQGVASSQPQVDLIGPAGPGSQVQPKPALYALVSAIAAFLITLQIVVVVGARRLAATTR